MGRVPSEPRVTTTAAVPLVDKRYHVYGDYYDRVRAVTRDSVDYDIERGNGRVVGTGHADRAHFMETRRYADTD